MTNKVAVHRIMAAYFDAEVLTSSSTIVYILGLNKTTEKVTLYRPSGITQVQKGYSCLRLSVEVDKLDSDLTVVKKACEGLAAVIEDKELATYTELKAKVNETVKDQFSVRSGGSVVADRERTAMAHLQKVIALVEGAKVRLDGKECELARVKAEWETTRRELENARKLMKKAHEELGRAVSVNEAVL